MLLFRPSFTTTSRYKLQRGLIDIIETPSKCIMMVPSALWWGLFICFMPLQLFNSDLKFQAMGRIAGPHTVRFEPNFPLQGSMQRALLKKCKILSCKKILVCLSRGFPFFMLCSMHQFKRDSVYCFFSANFFPLYNFQIPHLLLNKYLEVLCNNIFKLHLTLVCRGDQSNWQDVTYHSLYLEILTAQCCSFSLYFLVDCPKESQLSLIWFPVHLHIYG